MANSTAVEKVNLPKEVAEALEYLRRKGLSNYGILHQIEGALTIPSLVKAREWAYKGGGSMDTLMEALVNGYEVEQSPEDKLRDYYADAWIITPFDDVLAKHRKAGRREGVIRTLRILGVEVEGINKKETIV